MFLQVVSLAAAPGTPSTPPPQYCSSERDFASVAVRLLWGPVGGRYLHHVEHWRGTCPREVPLSPFWLWDLARQSRAKEAATSRAKKEDQALTSIIQGDSLHQLITETV